ncbi:MAG: cofactor assembly of complex C subunit B, partial [Synechococcaceae bacterium WB6_3A_227]|nr:cofactor assembly of complex C subunit B [Synechococcaceae bacterium WB6_3A_227]
VLMRRGILGEKAFLEGNILKRSRERQQQISLVNLELYPGAAEFSYFPELLPAILVTPIGERGWLLIGGWSVRCFSRSDERWAQGWADKLKNEFQQPGAFLQPGPGGNAAEYEPSGPVQ